MHSVCVMLEVKPDKIKDPEGGTKKVNDWWGPSKRVLSDSKFLHRLKTYDKDNIQPKIINKIRKEFESNEDFTPEKAKKSSLACAGMCKWVLAMSSYDRVAKI